MSKFYPAGGGVVTETVVDAAILTDAADTQVLFNNAGDVDGVSAFTFNVGTSELSVNSSIVARAANHLGFFSATTSAQLAGVLSDEEGSSGGFVRAGSPTLTSPTFATSQIATLRRPGGVTNAINPLNLSTTVFKVEDWIIAGAVCTAASRTCGEFHWWMTGTDSAMVGGAIETNHPGVRILRAGATTPVAGESCVIDTTAAAGTMSWDNNFDTIWVVKPGTSDTNTKTRFGLSPDFGVDPPLTGAYFEKEHAGDGGGSDTNWFFVCGDGTRNRADTLVAHGTDWVTGRIARVNATTIGWAICAGDGCTLPALTNHTTNCPSGATEARLGARVETNTTAARDLSLDYIDLLITGITR